ncbi:hypothetical protein TBLA_0B03360 [Henningerozyma blattae CBS 6284]|uniref:Uncharacterized protein n=1 Tax=Henningerozyma blattae (strain ATCC 34711 / CBS 6284 / DSM 70876 / NBRC 10599 / NRRL Y-10934 / UCD 77-7) TaxID=1071380 RepID=I2GYH5_HENB6|nr:hypothetical protein TBLA_0B03360 [Tetrapisispora blattae CBS 6284]CCH59177.1 hypothetical protein TBLA_0B03360 [Tetrapisispora blattae CBS 6284]
MAMVELDKYVTMIDAIISVSDPYQVSPKKIRKAIQELFAVDLTPNRKEMNDLILERFNALQENPMVFVSKELMEDKDEEIALRISENDKKIKRDSDNESSKRQARKATTRKKRKTTSARTPSSNGINAKNVILSDSMQEFLGEEALPRTQVVKRVWDYIKEHDLQNPKDRRQIICDEKMKPIFGKSLDMFQLTKVISKNLLNPDELVNGDTLIKKGGKSSKEIPKSEESSEE